MLDAMGIGQWKVSQAMVEADERGGAMEYTITVKAVPVLNGIPALDDQPMYDFQSEDPEASNYMMSCSYFIFSPNSDLIYFDMTAPVDVVQVINEGVAILPTEELMAAAQEELSNNGVDVCYGLPGWTKEFLYEYAGEPCRGVITVSAFDYGLARIKVPKQKFRYYYIPTLVLSGSSAYYGTDTGELEISTDHFGNASYDLIWLNAMDGSLIPFE